MIGSHPLSDKTLEVKRRNRKLTEENPQAVLRGQLIEKYGAGGENRTLMGQSPRDFESRASTNFTTPAHNHIFTKEYILYPITSKFQMKKTKVHMKSFLDFFCHLSFGICNSHLTSAKVQIRKSKCTRPPANPFQSLRATEGSVAISIYLTLHEIASVI